jgi:50S ribosomal protein L16 3-hydroxylase
MLHEWLRPLSVDEFRETHLGCAPYARPGAAASALAHLTWDVLGRILDSRPAPDVLVARDGRLAAAPPPRNLCAARELLDRKLGVVVRKAERHDEGFAQLARSFARDIPGEVHIQLYATPAGTRTFGWHFDSEEVFIAQTEGTKEYYMRANTVLTSSSPGLAPDFGAVRRETSPLLSARLIPGDWLYIPSCWWHLVHSNEDALSISIGVSPRRVIDTRARAHVAAG